MINMEVKWKLTGREKIPPKKENLGGSIKKDEN